MRTIIYKNKPSIISVSSIGGPKECEGNIGNRIKIKAKDDMFNEKTFEKAESKMLRLCIEDCIESSNLKEKDVDAVIAGDLLDQIVASTFAVRDFKCGFLGVYNACSTFCESLLLGANLIDSKHLNNVVCATSSHFSSAERQYRYPLELGSTRPPVAQWTVTGAGSCIISLNKDFPCIVASTIGAIVDFGITDANNMGAAMAPAACDTIYNHILNMKVSPDYYDLIVTGDLGTLGSRVLKDLLKKRGIDIEKNHIDCGELIYNINEKEYQGGSGAGCSSLVFCSYLYDKLKRREFNRILLVATGALLSSLTVQQGESIPCIAHAVEIHA